ncbi:hypothetical protein M3Y98_00057400 [Aphelenchoides besseyi]|nr:hypothetical protein M3Y98_00057400 [Aphelenchoides besseyi]
MLFLFIFSSVSALTQINDTTPEFWLTEIELLSNETCGEMQDHCPPFTRCIGLQKSAVPLFCLSKDIKSNNDLMYLPTPINVWKHIVLFQLSIFILTDKRKRTKGEEQKS